MNANKRDAYTFTENKESKGILAELRAISYEYDTTLQKVMTKAFSEFIKNEDNRPT